MQFLCKNLRFTNNFFFLNQYVTFSVILCKKINIKKLMQVSMIKNELPIFNRTSIKPFELVE